MTTASKTLAPPVDAHVLTDSHRAVIQGLGRCINSCMFYGAEHRLSQESMAEDYEHIRKALAAIKKMSFALVDGGMQVDGITVDERVPLSHVVLSKMKDGGLLGFSLLHGMSKDEYLALVKVLAALSTQAPRSQFEQALAKAGIQHVKADKIVIQRVSESMLNAKGGGGMSAAAKRGLDMDTAAPSMSPSVPDDKLMVGQILAFLKGDVAPSPASVVEAMKEAATAPEKLAKLIIDAAVIRQRSANLSQGESLADLVVGCIRRSYEAMQQDPSQRAPETNLSLRKSLVILEQKVMDRLRQMSEGAVSSVDRAIHAAFRDIQQDMDIRAVAGEYVRRKEALEKTEKWMVKHLRDNPDDRTAAKAQAVLAKAGLSFEGWQQLAVKSGLEVEPAAQQDESQVPATVKPCVGACSTPPELAVLAVLLSRLDELMKSDPKGADQTLAKVGEQVKSMSPHTMDRIHDLDRMMELDAKGGAGLIIRKVEPRKSPFVVALAEIVQELCQPVSAINCAVDMLVGGYAGSMTLRQKEILRVADECGSRLKEMLDKLQKIVGSPDGLKPEGSVVDVKDPA